MPNIKQFTSEAAFQGLHPSNLAVEGAVEMGRSFAEAGRQVGAAAEDVTGAMETSALSTEYAQTTAKLSQDTNAFFKNADPNDPELVEKYKDQVLSPTLDKFGSGSLFSARGQELAQRYRTDLEQNYLKTAIGDQASVAGGAVHQNLLESRNALSDAAYADPTQHDHLQAAWNNVVEAQIAAHQVTPEQAAEIRAEVGETGHEMIALGAGKAMAEKNPAAAAQDYNSGMFNRYLNGEQISTLNGYADRQQRASDVAMRAAEAQQRKAEDDQFSGQMSDFYTGMMRPDGTLAVAPNAPRGLVKLSLTPGGQRHASEIKSAMELIQRVSNDVRDGKTIVTDPPTYADFSHRMNLPDGDPNALTYAEVNTARASGQLSDRDHAMFRQSIADNAKDPKKRDAYSQFGKQMTALKGAITHSNILSGIVDSPGDQRYSEFLRYERNAMDDHYHKGDWQHWMDSGQLAKDATRFAPGFAPGQDMSKPAPYIAPPNMGGRAPAKRNPGESPEQYLKRIGQ